MREGWEVKKLGEVCERTKTIKWENHPNEEFEYIDLSSASREELCITCSITINHTNAPSRARKIVRTGDVIFATTRPTLRRVAIVPAEYDGQICSTGFVVLRPKENEVLTPWLFYGLQLDEFYNEMETLQKGAAYPAVTDDNVKDFQIPVPPLAQQERIVAILDEAFAAIDQAKANLERNLQNARDLFQSRLNQIFTEKGDGWVEKRLKDVCDKITDGTHQTPKYFESGYVFLSSKNVTGGKIDWDNVKYVDEAQHIALHKRLAPKRDDILLAKNGTTGVAAIVDRDIVFDIYVSLALIRSLGEVIPSLLLHIINSPMVKTQFKKRLKGVGVPNLHLEEIREVEISFPKSIEEQKQLLDYLDQLLLETKDLEEKYIAKLVLNNTLKQSLLQKAFSGELTDKEASKTAAAVI